MSFLSGTSLAIIRQPEQATDLYLGIYQPRIAEYGQLTPDAQIQGLPVELGDNFYTESFVSFNVNNTETIKNGMTILFGTAPGLDNIGKTFVRRKSGSRYYFSVVENIILTSGTYYTILDYHELWPVFPRVTMDSNNVPSYFKNYDIPYSNQNSVLMPVAVVGPNYAGLVDDVTGQKTVLFIATGSYCLDGSTINQVYWEINTSPSATILTGSIVSYTFPSSGHYTVETRVIGSNSITGTAYRHYLLLDKPGVRQTNNPVSDWNLESLTGDWDTGGWQAQVSVGEYASGIADGALAVIFADDTYGSQTVSFGGYPNREHIVFAGYVSKVENQNTAINSRSKFFLKSPTLSLQNREMFSVSLEYSTNPVDWTQIQGMTVNKMVDHYLRWHSTLFEVADYRPVTYESGNYSEQFEDIPKGELLSNVRNILQNRILASFVADRQGRIYGEVNLNYIPTGTRPATTLTFQNGDWLDSLKGNEILDVPVSSVLMGGVTFDSATNTGTALLSRAPDALFPLHKGKSETKSGLTLTDQTKLNVISGLYLADRNSRFSTLTMKLANNMRNIDIVPQELFELPTNFPYTNEDLRGLKTKWANKRLIPRRISYGFKNNSLEGEVIFDTETSGPPGETVRIPTVVPNGVITTPVPPGPVIPPPSEVGLRVCADSWTSDESAGATTVNDIYVDSSYVWSTRGRIHNIVGGTVVNTFSLPTGTFVASITGDATDIYIGSYKAAAPNQGDWIIRKIKKSDLSVTWTITISASLTTDTVGGISTSDSDTRVYVCGKKNNQLWAYGLLKSNGATDWSLNVASLGSGLVVQDVDARGDNLYIACEYTLIAQIGKVYQLRKSDGLTLLSATMGDGATGDSVIYGVVESSQHVIIIGHDNTASDGATVRGLQTINFSVEWTNVYNYNSGNAIAYSSDKTYPAFFTGIDNHAIYKQLRTATGQELSSYDDVSLTPSKLRATSNALYICGYRTDNAFQGRIRRLCI